MIRLLVLLLIGGCGTFRSPEMLRDCWAPATECRWSAFPLAVSSDRATAAGTKEALAWWNKQLGFEALYYVGINKTTADIRVHYGGRHGPRPEIGGLALFYSRPRRYSLILLFGRTVLNPRAYIHELGHSMGLKHDNNPASVMHKRDSLEMMLENRDREVLRWLYKR